MTAEPTIILVLGDPELPETTLRCEAYGAFLRRLRTVDGQVATMVSGASGPAAALATVAVTATVFGDSHGEHVRYAPSRQARERVVREEDGAWPSSVAARHRKLVRRSQGALFRLPLAGAGEPRAGGTVGANGPVGQGDGELRDAAAGCVGTEAGTRSVEVFVTDWTGMPSACAVAVHPAHPLSPGLGPGERSVFTGQFCRHPLTGDLLPIWVAHWVKPEFGTGAVLLNPGHNQVDLEFSREVGLPVRFSLAPAGADRSPGSWVEPPLIRSGVAVGAGRADGLPYDQAANVHLRTAADHGLAVRYVDSGMGDFPLAKITSEETAPPPAPGTADASVWSGGVAAVGRAPLSQALGADDDPVGSAVAGREPVPSMPESTADDEPGRPGTAGVANVPMGSRRSAVAREGGAGRGAGRAPSPPARGADDGLVPSATARVVRVPWDSGRRTVAGGGHGDQTVGLVPVPVLAVVEEPARSAGLTVVAPSAQVERDLLAVRLLLAEPGIEPAVKRAPDVVLVGNVVSLPDDVADGARRLALLVGGGVGDTLALKPQQVEPCVRFLEAHQRLACREPDTTGAASSEVARAASQVKALMVRWDLKQAFTQLYRLQKGLTRTDTLGEPDLACYAALAYVLAGLTGPPSSEDLASAWQQM